MTEPSEEEEEPGVRRGLDGGGGGLDGLMCTGCLGALEKREGERVLGKRAEDSVDVMEPASDLPRLMLRTAAKGRIVGTVKRNGGD